MVTRTKSNGKSKSTLRFSRLRLENWRNFRRAETNLQRRALVFGPNASGKSNLLDVFRFLHDIASTGGGFEEAVAKRGGVSKLRCLAARSRPNIEIEIGVADGAGETIWRYELHFTQDKASRPRIEKEQITKQGRVLVSRPDRKDRGDLEQLRQTHLEQVLVNKEFRELADFFRSVRYLHIVPQLVRDPDRYRGRENDPFGWDFLERVTTTPAKTRNAWLKRIENALRVAVPQLQELELWYDKRNMPHLRGKYEHWRPQGAWQTEEAFSDGTLRLLGLLWSALEGSGPLLLEEPEMSLHTDVVRFIPQMLARMQQRSGRQIVMSSHSADILRDEGIGLDEVLLLEPSSEGTRIVQADSIQRVQILLESGSSLADVVIPRTRPRNAEQLALFGD